MCNALGLYQTLGSCQLPPDEFPHLISNALVVVAKAKEKSAATSGFFSICACSFFLWLSVSLPSRFFGAIYHVQCNVPDLKTVPIALPDLFVVDVKAALLQQY